MSNRLFLVGLTFERRAPGGDLDCQSLSGLWSAETDAEALGRAVQEGSSRFPGYRLLPSKAVTDMSAEVRRWAADNPAESAPWGRPGSGANTAEDGLPEDEPKILPGETNDYCKG